tara:strand:- start:38887 stop:39504 length:618 start_codon:yes stop_codon:yes gene_type:complete
MDDISHDWLREAVETNSAVRVIYDGGSQAGAERVITPLAIDGDKLRARCHASGTVKVFKVSRVRLPGSDGPAAKYDSAAAPHREFSSFAEIVARYRDTLKGLGWHTEVTATHFTLHKVRKNGAPLKRPEVGISFVEFIEDTYWDQDETGELVEVSTGTRKSTRPYGVYGHGKSSASYGKADRAAALFFEWATTHPWLSELEGQKS